jgi:hypothetical protein
MGFFVAGYSVMTCLRTSVSSISQSNPAPFISVMAWAALVQITDEILDVASLVADEPESGEQAAKMGIALSATTVESAFTRRDMNIGSS